jgi:cold shock CspA family protein
VRSPASRNPSLSPLTCQHESGHGFSAPQVHAITSSGCHTRQTNRQLHRGAEVDSWSLGTVKWFNSEKGFGFIESDDVARVVFVDYRCIDMPGYKTLTSGQRVAYRYQRTRSGPEAIQVRPLAPTAAQLDVTGQHSPTDAAAAPDASRPHGHQQVEAMQ